MKRIMILGAGNAGKSTFAKKLGDTLDIPVYHLDQYCWETNWIMKSNPEIKKIHSKIIAKNTWIIDGSYTSVIQERLKRADTVIYLDVRLLVSIWRWLLRIWKYRNGGRPDMAEGNIERFNLAYLKLLIKHSREYKHRLAKLKHTYGDKLIYLSGKEATRYLDRMDSFPI